MIHDNGAFKHIETNHSSYYTFIDEEKLREQLFYPFLKEGMTVIDVGCAFGSYSLPALAKGCKVIAINPKEESNKVFKQNLKLNNFKARLIEKYASSDTYDKNSISIDSLKLKPDYIKIDVEGWELEVVLGATSTIRRYNPYILVEHHEFIKKQKQTIIDFICSLGKYTNVTSLPYIDMNNIRQINLDEVQVWHSLFIPDN